MANIKIGSKTYNGINNLKVLLSDGSDYVIYKLNGDIPSEPIESILSITEDLLVPINGTATIEVNTNVSDTIIWTSSDTSIATVNNGVVTWLKGGKCTVTASIPSKGLEDTCFVKCESEPTAIMSSFKYLGATTYSPGTYTAWCPTGLIYDETRDVYAHFMHVQNTHYVAPNVCELWFNTINPNTLEHSEPIYVDRTKESLETALTGGGALGCCVKNGIYYMFSNKNLGYYKSIDGGVNWTHETYETAPDTSTAWGCYVLSNGRMIMGSDDVKHKIFYSDDDGKNWITVQSSNFNEPTFIEFGNGVIMAICRENMDSDKNIQKPWMHVSNDYGETWTEANKMETVGYMGNNNCNAYVHDNYVELFVGCRIPTDSPQYTDTLYQINQYVMDINKGAVDEFEFVNTVYQYKNDDNPQGITTSLASADDFSTPCIAIKDKSHSLLTFYAPTGKNVTHHMVAVGNIPVDDFEIPKPMPSNFTASQSFTGNNEEITICQSKCEYDSNKYPKLNCDKNYLLVDDIQEGGYVHIRAIIGNYNGWEVPVLTNVKDMVVYSGNYGDALLPKTPLPTGVTTRQGVSACGLRMNWLHKQTLANGYSDIYARFKNDAWWLFYEGSWIRNYTCETGAYTIPEEVTWLSPDNAMCMPYHYGGMRSYKTVALPRTGGSVYIIEYDKDITL